MGKKSSQKLPISYEDLEVGKYSSPEVSQPGRVFFLGNQRNHNFWNKPRTDDNRTKMLQKRIQMHQNTSTTP